MKGTDNFLQCFMSDNAHTIKITCVIFGFQLGNKFCLLSQQTVPVQRTEESVLFDFVCTTWGQGGGVMRTEGKMLNYPPSKGK